MITKINGVEVVIKGNPTLERNVKEELDTGSIVVENTKEKRYEMYDKVEFTTPFEDEEQYLVQADNPVQLNATEYQHNLTLFENIAFFNTIYPADRSFKVKDQTLEDILTVYKRELAAYHNIIITWVTIPQTVLDETIPFKEFAGLNLSSILLSLFRKIWAVPKVNRISDNWDIYPLYHNEKNNSIAKESISKISQQNNIDYATQVKSQLKNAVNERTADEVSWFPSENGWVLPRSSSLEKISSKLRYELDSNIITILKVEVIDVDYRIIYDNGEPYDTVTNETVDITSQIIQDEAWDLLTTETSVDYDVIMSTDNVKNHIRYKVGQPYITNLFEGSTDGIIFKFDTEYTLNAIRRALYLDHEATPAFDFIGLDDPLDTEDVKMRFKYLKQRNIDLVHIRKTKGTMNETTTIHQQRDASVEVNEYKKNLKLYSNRMGNTENSKTKVFVYPDEPYELFDYTDEKTIVTRVQNTWHNLFVYCEYEESENFSNIEAEYALMRRSDPYTINAKAVTTNLVIKELIEFSAQSRDLDTRFTSNARRMLLGLFEATTMPYDKVSVGVFKPTLASWNGDYAIHMPVESSGDGDLITMHVQFPHQTIAGKTYYDLATDTYEDYLNPLPYTDSEGSLENYELYFTPDILFEDAGQYPLILDETLYLASKYTEDSVTEPIDLDVAASFAVTLQVSFVADDNIYIGNAMASLNYFVREQNTTSSIKIYTSTKPYGQYDQAPRSYDTDNTANISYAYSFANRTITITPTNDMEYFSIVKDDNILFAVNRLVAGGNTIIINVNHLNISGVVFRIEALSNVLSSFVASSSMAYTLRTYYIETISNSLSSFEGAATLNYLSRTYYLEAVSSVLSDLVGTSSLSFTNRTYYLEANSSTLSAITGTVNLTYTSRIQYLEANSSALSNVTGNCDLTYYYFNANSSALSSLNGTIDITVPATAVEWNVVSSGTPDIDQCIYVTDEGNIKEVSTPYCVFENDGDSYTSSTDVGQTEPACQTGQTWTQCLLFEGTWYCQDYIGQEGTTDVLYECQLK